LVIAASSVHRPVIRPVVLLNTQPTVPVERCGGLKTLSDVPGKAKAVNGTLRCRPSGAAKGSREGGKASEPACSGGTPAITERSSTAWNWPARSVQSTVTATGFMAAELLTVGEVIVV